MSEELKPCPFCGSTNLKAPDDLSECEMVGSDTSIYCDDCGARGPETKLSASDSDAWNRRAPAQEGMREALNALYEITNGPSAQGVPINTEAENYLGLGLEAAISAAEKAIKALSAPAEPAGISERLHERAAIVAWLRNPAGKGSDDGVDFADDFADAIEAGRHSSLSAAAEPAGRELLEEAESALTNSEEWLLHATNTNSPESGAGEVLNQLRATLSKLRTALGEAATTFDDVVDHSDGRPEGISYVSDSMKEAMTHPTPEQVDGAIERLRGLDLNTVGEDLAIDLAILLSVVERLREALKPFAQYGAILRGQLVRHDDRTLIELFDCKITVRDLICAADSIP